MRKTFTLVELLVVVSILALLAAMFFTIDGTFKTDESQLKDVPSESLIPPGPVESDNDIYIQVILSGDKKTVSRIVVEKSGHRIRLKSSDRDELQKKINDILIEYVE